LLPEFSPPLVHPPAEHLVLYVQLSLSQLGASGVVAEVTSDAMAFTTPSRVSRSLPDRSRIDSHLLSVQNPAVARLVDKLKGRVRLVSIADAVTEVDVYGTADGETIEDNIAPVLAKLGAVEFRCFFGAGCQVVDCVLCKLLDVGPWEVVRSLDSTYGLGNALAGSATKRDVLTPARWRISSEKIVQVEAQ
jgi:hypothetical protein